MHGTGIKIIGINLCLCQPTIILIMWPRDINCLTYSVNHYVYMSFNSVNTVKPA